MLIENGANIYKIDQNGITILHHAIDSKNFETIAVIVRQLTKDKQIEMNREVGLHKWTPLYRASRNKSIKSIEKKQISIFSHS
jgi:ankyrin repeat protein